jgi:outer membrane protein TolC
MVKVRHSVKQENKNTKDITSQLKTAKELLDAGAITRVEFEQLTQKILK